MDYSLTTDGQNTTASLFRDAVDAIAVGRGNTAVTGNETALENEAYRAAVSADEAAIQTADTAGAIEASLIVVGGVTVPADTDLYELGLFDETGDLLYRQVSDSPYSVGSGQSLQIESQLSVVPYNN